MVRSQVHDGLLETGTVETGSGFGAALLVGAFTLLNRGLTPPT
ncbi:MAG: hypothetical protein ACRDUS_03430 [Mycobacterium sp.]